MEGEFIKFGKNLVPKEEFLSPGHRACGGCGLGITIRLSLKVLGRDTVVGVPAGCWTVVGAIVPYIAWRVNWMETLFENSAAVMSGVESGLKALTRKGKIPPRKVNVVVFAGDGATNDIGVSALSGALERGHDFLYICLDNEAYMNPGVQRSSATPHGAATTTSPVGKVTTGQLTWKKNMAAIVAAHDIPYVATASPSYPFDLMNKVKKGAEIVGPAYIHVLAPCPTGWRLAPNLTIDIGKLAVETGVFPLYEVEDGRYKLSVSPAKLKPVEEYLKPQGRFRHLTQKEIAQIQERVEREYSRLQARVAAS